MSDMTLVPTGGFGGEAGLMQVANRWVMVAFITVGSWV